MGRTGSMYGVVVLLVAEAVARQRELADEETEREQGRLGER